MKIRQLARIWWMWAAVYAGTGMLGMGRHSTGMFAQPLDCFESAGFKMTFLNFPLQMAFALLAVTMDDAKFAGSKILAWLFGVTATMMIVANFALGLWFNLQ